MTAVCGTGRRRVAIVLAVGAGALLLSAPAASGDVERKRFFFSRAEGTPSQVFFKRAGVRLTGTCASGLETSVSVASRSDNAMVHLNGQGNEGLSAAEDNDFDNGELIEILSALGLDGEFDSGQIVFSRPNGVHVTIDWATIENTNGAPADHRCMFFGAAQVAAPGRDPRTRKRIDFRADARRGKTVLTTGGLRLRATCGFGHELDVVAKTEVDHAVVHANGQGPLGADYTGVNNLRVHRQFAFLSALGTDTAQTGQLIYANPKGTVVTVDWLVEDVDAYAGRFGCAFVGTARVLRRDDPDRAWFAPKRSRPILVPRASSRGVPAPDFQTFHKRGPFSLIAGCSDESAGWDHNLDALAAYSRRGGMAGNEQSLTDDGIVGSSAFFASAGPLLETPSDNSGHAVMFTADGAVMSVDWLGQEDNAFGTQTLRRKCLIAGTTDLFRAPG